MIIDQLPLLSGDVVATDEIPVERGTTTYKTTPDKFLAAMTKDAVPTQGSENAVESGGVYDALQTVDAEIATKQNALTFDSAPTQGSSNPVTSGGVYTAIENATPEGFVSYAEAQLLTSAQQQQARDNIGAGWHLLWTNSNPSSDFAAQTVSLDLTNYTEIRIDVTLNSNSLEYGNEYVAFKGTQIQYLVSYFNLNAGGAITAGARTVVVSDAGVVFSDGYQKAITATGNPTTANNRVVPLRIYAR